jgi:hypothetical protein
MAAMDDTFSFSSFTNTPTVWTKGGKTSMIWRALSGATRLGLAAKTNPRASAPNLAAAKPSFSLVIPQILMRTLMNECSLPVKLLIFP